MSKTQQHGFTLIESLLFLAITGTLIIAILAGTGAAINTQRYRDSVASLKSSVQSQYSDVINVRNEERVGGLTCDSEAQATQSGAAQQRGQTDCVVMGRYIVIDDNVMTAYTVIGYNPAPTTQYANDIAELQDYNLSRLTADAEAKELEWGAQIAWPVSGSGFRNPTTPRTFSMLILRSPTSGLVYTFTADSDVSDIETMVIAGTTQTNDLYGQAQRRICVVSGDGAPGSLAVVIPAYASGQSAIEIRTNDMGDNSRC